MENFKVKNAMIFACMVPLLLLADELCYIMIRLNVPSNSYRNFGIETLRFYIYIFLVMTCIYLLICLVIISRDKTKFGKFIFVALIVINILSLWSTPDLRIISSEHLANTIWIVTDIGIAAGISTKFNELKIGSIFKTVEVTETYRKYGKEIKKREKTYPVLLPIIVAVISASGAIIASLVTKK